MSSTSSKNASSRASWIANSNLCAIHQTKAIHDISSFIIARIPLFFPELTAAASAPIATMWFLNSGKPRKRVKTNYFSIKSYFQSRFYCQSKLSNQPKYLALADYKKQVSKYKHWERGCYPALSSSKCYSFFYKKTISNRKKPRKIAVWTRMIKSTSASMKIVSWNLARNESVTSFLIL